ncbi:uncharacterized protein LAJ45_01358 [Morchella importuna]|uniref:uncharacterized protein n=1 Tax=Morchella importuna TaxID=1174673 RepID=UPI001E8E99F9|nr:uncharacterized protein LAJ45_01358 [Morchella importuna]KAH8154827.1 hypothetical protein LAJ45_01358 [Morchella importuna]
MAEPEADNLRIQHTNPQDVDLSDETQDFRFLNLFKKADPASLPRRGEKDFEPDGTTLQDTILHESRLAMHEALLGERKHSTKAHVEATWRPAKSLAQVKVARGPHFKTVGRADKHGVLWLLPEETIYLVERGNLECWWEEGIPMSLQGAYASCLDGCGGLERYQVYAYLKRAGYIVQRAATFDEEPEESASAAVVAVQTVQPRKGTSGGVGLTSIVSLAKTFFSPALPAHGPIIGPGTYRSYDAIYTRLSLIPSHHPPRRPTHPVSAAAGRAPFRVAYNVWKPRPSFKKSDPPAPDFRVAVVSARETSLPTLRELAALFDSVPVDAETAAKAQFSRLKDGWRNVVLAVVDSGVTSYLKIGDVGFAGEEMWKWKPGAGRGGKRGGRGGRGGARGGAPGRGRGR